MNKEKLTKKEILKKLSSIHTIMDGLFLWLLILTATTIILGSFGACRAETAEDKANFAIDRAYDNLKRIDDLEEKCEQ